MKYLVLNVSAWGYRGMRGESLSPKKSNKTKTNIQLDVKLKILTVILGELTFFSVYTYFSSAVLTHLTCGFLTFHTSSVVFGAVEHLSLCLAFPGSASTSRGIS